MERENRILKMLREIILMATSVAILLAGCTKNEIVRTADNSQEISFSAYDSRVATKADLKNGSFQVTAEYKKDSKTTTYFTDEKFTWNGSDKFTSTTTHYWPIDGGTLTFYATMPDKYSGTSTAIVPADTVDFTADGKTDFMAACLKDKTSSNTDPLAFTHKLTKVSFTAKGQDTNLKYVISSVKLTANSVARYAMVTSESWTSAATSKEYTVLGSDSTLVAGTTTAKAIGAAQLLIPNQPSTANTVKLTVKYKVYDGTNLVDDYSAGVDVDLTTSAASWGINKSFVYNLTLGVSSSVTPITFNAEQNDWGAEVKDTVDVPKQVPHYIVGSNDYGEGIKIGETWWAPVNCGYDDTHTAGLLYQWGRKYGQAYEQGTISPSNMNKSDDTEGNRDKFGKYDTTYYNWFSGGVDNTLWNGGTKGEKDPCPKGWRVPTDKELNALLGGNSSPAIVEVEGQNGFYFNGTSSASSGVFLPAAGSRGYNNGSARRRGSLGYYWSSSVDGNNAWALGFYDGSAYMGYNGRANGGSVRCVQE